MNTATTTLVFFDFDGTLTAQDTILPLGLFLARTRPNRSVKVSQLFFYLAMLKLRFITNHGFKERFCKLLLKGQLEESIAKTVEDFMRDYVERSLKGPIVEALLCHVRNGDEVYLVSSNFSFLLCHLQTMWALSGIVATEAECTDGRYTGRIAGRSCDGREKLVRTVGLFGEEKVRAATAYGDSVGDRELLTFVKCSNWV